MTDLANPTDISINHPAHYTRGRVECIEAMRAASTPEQFQGHLRLTALKYLWRYDQKGAPLEDLKKARWYLDRLIGELSSDG